MKNKALTRLLMVAGLLGLLGCGQSSSTTGTADSSTGNSATSGDQKPAIPFLAPKPIVVDAGTPIEVTVDESVSSKTSNPGDHFDASLAAPVMVGDKVAIPSGAKAVGTVTDAKSAGKFKGNAAISVTLASVTVNGERYPVQTTSVTEAGKGRGKRTAIGAGGGDGLVQVDRDLRLAREKVLDELRRGCALTRGDGEQAIRVERHFRHDVILGERMGHSGPRCRNVISSK